ncbi:response regulator [Serratia rubidaea]|uniref:Response regulator n=1 Tax=Serratia rubidaea TaxID=61652 RepID=A0A3S4YPE1_SERRU|nr:response regulator [Serratia rubidaea]MBH1930371.1 response regulator [Serratia rubidaea]MDC6117469.1 response regulator [Serratia rubidaea]MEB7587822.1 response regulator [Serratia rubidaea]VEI65419.1 Virulence factors putative positive transcription regulator BvgA [Serratia rubidaea]
MNNVLIVDDHPVARLAVKMLLEQAKLTVIGETDDGLEALRLTKQLAPDLVVVDIDIPSINGIDVVQRLRKNGYGGGILVLTGKDDDHYVKRCANAGADGFISKRNNLTELHDAVRALRGGYGYFPIQRARLGAAAAPGDDKSKIADLSAKELQVLHYLAKGVKVVDIGVQMQISDKTVSTYKRRLMQKLELSNMVELYDFTQRNNLD